MANFQLDLIQASELYARKITYRVYENRRVFFQEHPHWITQATRFAWNDCQDFQADVTRWPAYQGDEGFMYLTNQGYTFKEPFFDPDWLRHYIPRRRHRVKRETLPRPIKYTIVPDTDF